MVFDAENTEAAAPLFRPLHFVPRYSELGAPSERREWWAPAGWLLVIASTAVLYGAFLALSPLVLPSVRSARVSRASTPPASTCPA